MATHDYALLYFDEPINDIMPIIPFSYCMVDDNEPFFDQSVMLCGYPALEYRFSQQFVSSFIKAKEETMADMEVIRLGKKDNTFQYTTLDGKKVKKSFNPSFKMIDIDILNKNEDAQEEILNKIFEIGYQDRLYPSILLPKVKNIKQRFVRRDRLYCTFHYSA